MKQITTERDPKQSPFNTCLRISQLGLTIFLSAAKNIALAILSAGSGMGLISFLMGRPRGLFSLLVISHPKRLDLFSASASIALIFINHIS